MAQMRARVVAHLLDLSGSELRSCRRLDHWSFVAQALDEVTRPSVRVALVT